MAETFTLSELVIPGTYIQVRAEGLISVGGISTGNIGIVGTARRQRVDPTTGNPVTDANNQPVFDDIYDATYILSDYESARTQLGAYDRYAAGQGTLNLTRAVELLYKNGARTIYARPLDPTQGTGQDAFIAAFDELVKDDVNILVAPQLSTDTAKAVFGAVLQTAANNNRDVIAVVGCDATNPADITNQVTASDRMIMTAPGILSFDAAAGTDVTLGGTYSAPAVAGLLSSLAPQASPTNQVLPGVVKLARRFSYGEMKQLVTGGVVVLEERQGVRVVRGVTTEMATNGPFRQITTRRITDFAKAGIRQASDPFIGRLNNQRVRKALQTTIDGFLTTMVQDEALTAYTLTVTATREDEIAGRAIVNAVLQPTFSIDFVAVTLVLQ